MLFVRPHASRRRRAICGMCARPFVAFLVVLTTIIAVAAPSTALSGTGVGFQFYKNWSDPTNSGLQGFNYVNWTQERYYRSGSGRSTDECHRSDVAPLNTGGWLPSGGYGTLPWADTNYWGGVIGGPVVRIPDHQCSNGSTWRTDLFIHSWPAFATPGDYHSQACIKLWGVNNGCSNASSASCWQTNNWTGDIMDAVNWYNWYAYFGSRGTLNVS